jgi:hypothetical protein
VDERIQAGRKPCFLPASCHFDRFCYNDCMLARGKKLFRRAALSNNHYYRVRGLEHLPPVSTPLRRFLSRLTCWAPAQRRSLGAKITRKLPAHRCFAVFTEQNWAEARRRPQGILSYFQGLERSISPILPAKTDRGSSPLTLTTAVGMNIMPVIFRFLTSQSVDCGNLFRALFL